MLSFSLVLHKKKNHSKSQERPRDMKMADTFVTMECFLQVYN
jgi:hypothetical protein